MNQRHRLRHVVIGVGAGILGAHLPALQSDKVKLVAVADIDAARGQERASELGCAFYTDHRRMLEETRPEVAVILTPHPSHAPLAIDCLLAGCHVLVEKPMAVHVAQADEMIAAADEAGQLLAVNLQQRFRPEVQRAKEIIQSGQLGELQRVVMVETMTRTAAYYRMASWRGTWTGEGGGVLLNQAPHDLDLLCYLIGLPSRVVAWTRTQLHRIETEDTAQAMLEWSDGTLGTLHVSTAEAGQPQRLEIVGTKGLMHVEWGALTLRQFEMDLREFVADNPGPYNTPASQAVPVVLEPGRGNHLSVYRNFHAAIGGKELLMADGVAGRMSLELANAIIYSSHKRQEVALPLDHGAYAALLNELKMRHAHH